MPILEIGRTGVKGEQVDVVEAVEARVSIRGYKAKPVPKDVLAEVLSISLRSPSPVNVQPWEITVLAGKPLEELKQANARLFEEGREYCGDARFGPYSDECRRRQVELARQVYGVLGIAREDKAGRQEWERKGLQFFGAPAAIIIAVDEGCGEHSAYFSAGLLAQTIALVALKYGLGTCIMMQGVVYPDEVRRITGIGDSKRLIISLSIGYPDPDCKINKLRTPREELGRVVTWQGFEEAD